MFSACLTSIGSSSIDQTSKHTEGKTFYPSNQASQRLDDMTEQHEDVPSSNQTSRHNKGKKFLPFTTTVSQSSGDITEQHKAVSYPAHIIERIRQLYKIREKRLFPLPWCEDFSFHLNDMFTRLTIFCKEKIRGTLTDEITDMTAIFKTHEDCENPRTVLIEGDPGMGKTTYCQKLAYDWATKQEEWDNSFPKIEVLLLLRCHDIKSDIWEAIDTQILPDDVDEETKKGFLKYIRDNQSKVLLVLDGLDEEDPGKLKMYIDLLESKVLPDCHIIVTSRHEAGTKMRRYMDSLWEIVGFTKSRATDFIRKYFRTKKHLADKLFERLSEDRVNSLSNAKSENLTELTTNPLNTALLCVLCEDFEGILPENRTDLYMELICCVLRRYEKKNGISNNNEDPITVYKKELIHLGRMALQSLLEGELYIEEHKFDFNSTVLIKFGFLSIQSGSSKRKPCSRYGFLHKSFHEFFAGLYLAFQILDGELDCDSVVTDERYRSELKQVFFFTSSILASRSEDTLVSLVTSIAKHINLKECPSDKDTQTNLEFAFDCIMECNTHKENLHPQLVHTLGKNLNLKSLDITFDDWKEYCCDLFCEVLKVNTCLTKLVLIWIEMGDSGVASLSEALKVNTCLTELNLIEKEIGDSAVASLSEALKVNTCLTKLVLIWIEMGDSGAASLSEALRVNTCLTELNLNENEIGASGAASLSEALKVNTCLIKLHMIGNWIGASGAASLSEALKVNTCLAELDLSRNGIGASGAASLSEALKVNTCLIELHLCGNEIGASGAASLSEALKVNTCLTTLDLWWNEIGDSGALLISEACKANKIVEVVNY